MTNRAADGTARVAEKEKVEKRRALGRGLESVAAGAAGGGGSGRAARGDTCGSTSAGSAGSGPE